MRISSRFLPVLIILSVYLIISCQKEIKPDIVATTPVGTVINASPVQGDLTGKVVDENDAAVAGAIIRSGNLTIVTDARGLFRFDDIEMDKYATKITAEVNGYFKAIKTFSATANSVNFIKIKLIQKSLAGNIDATAGGIVTLSDNSQLIIPASGVVNKTTNLPYTGTIKIFAAPIDPTDEDISLIVPGSFQGNDGDNFRVLLKSFGMMAVELEGNAGEALQIASGKKAALKFTIPASLRTSAPEEIPLWYVDENTGLWQEDGSAVKNGNFYEGEVSHFSFWNCDINMPTVYLELTVVTVEGALPFTPVKITRVNGGGSSYGYTDSNGHVGGLVPKNEPLLLEILSNCSQPIYSQNISPLSANTNLGTITVTIPAQNSLEISGNAVDCSNAPVTDGNALIYFDGHLYNTPITGGGFSLTVTRCSNSSASVEVIVIDNLGNQQSTSWTGTATSGNVNTGTLSACGTSSVNTIDYTVDGTSFSLNSAIPGDSITTYGSSGTNQTSTFVYGFKLSQPDINISFSTAGNTTGTFPLQYLTVNQYDSVTVVTPFNIIFTSYGAPGQFIEGNFNGQIMEISNGNLHTVSATFRVRRR